VGISIGTTLPETLGTTEVNLDIDVQDEAFLTRHIFTVILGD
jgi:hypothetical protein